MPDLSRYLIKTSLIYLAGALFVGMVLTPPVITEAPELAAIQPGYVHTLVVGWLTQLIFGVAYWLFPRHSRETPYGNRRLPQMGFVLLNAGLILRLVSEAPQVWFPAAVWSWMLALSAFLQWLAGTLFAVYLWTRTKSK